MIMVGTIGAGVLMEWVGITHGYGIVGAMELMEVMVGAGTTHGVGTDGTDGTIGAGVVALAGITGAGAVALLTDGVDGIPLIIMVTVMEMVIMVTDIMETGTMADMGTIEITP
jgi:hypothetical protein